MISGISTLFHLLYGCSSSESCLFRQIKKRVKVDPGGGEAGLLWEDQRLHLPLALSAFPESPLTQVISQLRSIDTHSWGRENVSCLQLSFIVKHILPTSFHPISSLGWRVYSIHSCGGTRRSPLPISALRDDRVKDRQEANLPERTVLVQGVGGRLPAHPFCLLSPRIHYNYLPINHGSTHHRR